MYHFYNCFHQSYNQAVALPRNSFIIVPISRTTVLLLSPLVVQQFSTVLMSMQNFLNLIFIFYLFIFYNCFISHTTELLLRRPISFLLAFYQTYGTTEGCPDVPVQEPFS